MDHSEIYEVERPVPQELSQGQLSTRAKIQTNRRIRRDAIRAVMTEGDKFIFPEEPLTAALRSSKKYAGIECEYIRTQDGWVYVRFFMPNGKKPVYNLSVVRFYEAMVTLGKIKREV